MNPVNTASIIQAARGPILLITVGVLMVIDYNTPFSFSRTWPALIIVFGLLKLLERMAGPAPVPPYVAPPYTTTVPPGLEPPPGGYQTSGYQGSAYEPGPGYQVPPQNPGGHPQ
jgi:Domain of unknown function (DUF5668)